MPHVPGYESMATLWAPPQTLGSLGHESTWGERLNEMRVSCSIFNSHRSSPFQQPVEKQEENCAADRDREASDVEPRNTAEPELGSDEPTNHCPRDAEY